MRALTLDAVLIPYKKPKTTSEKKIEPAQKRPKGTNPTKKPKDEKKEVPAGPALIFEGD
jgi:hypothetical protein